MKPFYILIGAFVVSSLVLKLTTKQFDYPLAGRIAMAFMLVFTAIGHFAFSNGMTAMVPSIVPFKMQVVIATGILEVLFAIGLLLPKYSHATGWVLIAFFVLILPANIKASLENINYQTGNMDGPGLSYLWIRIPLQLFFIVWVYFSTIRTN
ncbi:hypothetical protein J0X14_01750 [Muricauda sp. CAU 1633]|uniref:DoxX family protein n=1 Tax=Allomuricauda sp. CAU 1633 TaxID=2816036 RepID=UPI001A8CFFA1|nr:hypothetical protein [Muricauda sp. CAU 1633]MBO0321004.1 hypothetical protein [Muricauda sp. CAU 1633]